MSGSSNDGGRSVRDVVRPLSAVLFAAGLLLSAGMLAMFWEQILLFVLAGVFPSLLGYAGLAWSRALPWQGRGTASEENEEDLVVELKRRYAKGELDDAEMERKVETLLASEDDGGLSATTGERERERTRL
jgi:uncharacterized membrane protein